MKSAPITDKQWQEQLAERKEGEALLNDQMLVLEQVASGAPLTESLDTLVRLIEKHAPGMLGSILLLDEEGIHLHHGASPSLPLAYSAAIDGVSIGPEVGSCGTAAFRAEAVYVEDIATDPRWSEFKAVALPHGLRACWSTPVFDAQRRVLGTFAMYYRQPGLPQPHHRRLIEITTHITAIAICRHRMESELRQSAERLRLAVQASNVGLWDWDLSKKKIVFAQQWKRQLGYQEHELANEFSEWEERVHPADHASTMSRLHACLEGKYPEYAAEYRLRHKDGAYRWIYAQGEVFRNAQGQPVRMLGCHLDITERKRAEKLLLESRQLQLAIIDNSVAVIYVKDREGRYLLINRRFEELFHVRRDTIIGQTDADIFPKTFADAFQAFDRRVLAAGTAMEVEEEAPQDDGMHTFLSIKAPLFDAQEEPYAVCGISTDITGRKRDEREIRRLNEELGQKIVQLQGAQEELVRKEKLSILGQLSGSIGHELRNPLGVMSNALYFLKMVLAESDETVKEYLGIIGTEIENSSRIITDLLDFARTRPPRLSPVAPEELIRRSLVRCAVPDNVTVTVDITEGLPHLHIDPLQMEQVLTNFITNGVQAMSDGGALHISARLALDTGKDPGGSPVVDVGTGAPPGFLDIGVADTGQGITPENMKKLFQPLFTTKAKGIGLGLVVCRSLTETNGGRIEVESRPGKGTCFTVKLPVHGSER